MFIKRNHSSHRDRKYRSILLVHGERVPVEGKAGRLSDGRKTRVVHRTLANLALLPDALIALVQRYIDAEREGLPMDTLVSGPDVEPIIGPAYGPLASLLALARKVGIERALGDDRRGKLAMFLILARIIHRGSRLSAIEWAKTQAVGPVLALGSFDEDDLYETLDWLELNQGRIEKELSPKTQPGAVFLYDVTSSYLEGQKNELAAPGYNRDGKRHKKQIVAGLLTDQDGDPISVQVYQGNTSDPDTVADQVKKLVEQVGAQEAVLVGDRGMVKAKGKELLHKHGFRFITSLTDPEIRKMLAQGILQMDLFDESVTEVEAPDGKRYVLRRNPAMTARNRSRRADQLAKVRKKIDVRNAEVEGSERASPEVSLRTAMKWLGVYHLNRFVTAKLDGARVNVEVDEGARAEVEKLDGCYVVSTDVPKMVVDKETIWERYGDLQHVERDFRTMKTGLLQLRPLFLRKANRTRAHALVTMLALKITRALRRAVASLGLCEQAALDRLEAVRLVSLAAPELGLWRLPTRWIGPEREVLAVLPPLPAPHLLSLRPKSHGDGVLT